MNQVPRQDWYQKAAFEMVRNNKTLFQYANEANLGITSRECENVSRTKEFAEALRIERNRFYKELSIDPSRSRNTAVGQLLFTIQKLLENESYDKAAASLALLFKVEGWTSDSAQVNIFQDLNAKDIDALRAKLAPKPKQPLAN